MRNLPFLVCPSEKSEVFFAPVGRKKLIKLSPLNGNIAFVKDAGIPGEGKNFFSREKRVYPPHTPPLPGKAKYFLLPLVAARPVPSARREIANNAPPQGDFSGYL